MNEGQPDPTLPAPYRAGPQTVTRAHLAEIIYSQVGLSRNESAELLEAVLNSIARVLEGGQSLKISGFGTFAVRQKGRRIGRNPKTGLEVPILPRRVLVFRPSQVLKARINGLAIPPGAEASDELDADASDDLDEDELDGDAPDGMADEEA